MRVEYSILDPTGNVTILVTTKVDAASQPYVAAKLMELHPEAEQAGFLSMENGYDIALRMAGGEFCGNASMCAAAAWADGEGLAEKNVRLRVSGAADPVMAKVRKLSDGTWSGTVDMPRPLSIEMTHMPGAGMLPVVVFDGISHVIYEAPEPDYGAETYIADWCRQLGADALGIMFLNAAQGSMTPLVYVPAAGTLFWENSCASGTTACGAYLASKGGRKCEISLRQPGGCLVISAVPGGELRLSGNVRIKGHYKALV